MDETIPSNTKKNTTDTKAGDSSETTGDGPDEKSLCSGTSGVGNTAPARGIPGVDGANPRLLLFGVSGLVLALAIISSLRPSNPVPPSAPRPSLRTRADMVKEYQENLAELRSLFPSQTSTLWRLLTIEGRRVLKDDSPGRPAVVLFPATSQTLDTAHCLLGRFADVITASYLAEKPTILDADRDPGMDSGPDEVKLHIDETLARGFEKGSKVGMIRHLENVNPEAAMILHGYADDDNAPYKDAFILLSIKVKALPQGEERDMKLHVYKEMTEMLSNTVPESSYSPLLGRIAKAVVFVNPEDDKTLDEIC